MMVQAFYVVICIYTYIYIYLYDFWSFLYDYI